MVSISELAQYQYDHIQRLGQASMITRKSLPHFEGSFDDLVAQVSPGIHIPLFHVKYEGYNPDLQTSPDPYSSDLEQSLARLALNLSISPDSPKKM